MSFGGAPCAYMVTSLTRTSRGTLALCGQTICHDRDLAVEMARSDLEESAWVAVFAVREDGRILFDAPVFCEGELEPRPLSHHTHTRETPYPSAG